jgi:hypothetical protein
MSLTSNALLVIGLLARLGTSEGYFNKEPKWWISTQESAGLSERGTGG